MENIKYYLFLPFQIILLFVIVSLDLDISSLAKLLIWVIGGPLIYMLILTFIGEKEDNANTLTNKQHAQVIKNTNIGLENYQSAKSKFKYISNASLHKIYIEKNIEDKMVQLALEEELVDRGIIEYSPMHEKLNSIIAKKNLNNY